MPSEATFNVFFGNGYLLEFAKKSVVGNKPFCSTSPKHPPHNWSRMHALTTKNFLVGEDFQAQRGAFSRTINVHWFVGA